MTQTKFYVIVAILMALVVFTASVTAIKMVDIKKLSKTNRDGQIEANINAIGEIEQSNLIITYMGRSPRYPTLEALKTSEDRFECSIIGNSYTCTRQGNNKVGVVDVTEQFSIKVTETSLASSRACGRTLATDTLPCLLVQTNYEVKWKTPFDLILGYYKVEFTATDEQGNIRADKNRFRSVRQKTPSLSTTQDTPTTLNTNGLQPTDSDQESNKNNNNRNLPIEPITLQELVQCQKLFVQIIRGMHNPNIDTADLDLSMADLNKDGIISLSDLVVFQQHYRNPGWCRAFFEPKLETSG